MSKKRPNKKSRLTKRQQTELLKKKSNLSYSEINKLNKADLTKLINISISQYSEKIKQNKIAKAYKQSTGQSVKAAPPKLTKKDYRHQKADFLRHLGFEPYDYTTKQIDSIKISDIRSGKFNEENYPFLNSFDFYKPYTLVNGKRMYFAYMDYSGEVSLEDLIEGVRYKTTNQLLNELNNIVNMSPTAKPGKAGTSSGKGGEISYHCESQNLIVAFAYEDNLTTRRSKRRNLKRQKSVTTAGFQILKNGSRNSFDIVTPRGLLEIAVALMYNATEISRMDFYTAFYYDCIESIPELKRYFPTPI